MNSWVIVSSLCVFINAVHCSEEVPVLAWGNGLPLFDFHVPAHRKLSSSEFHQNFLEKLSADDTSSTIVTFVAESLSPEDLQDKGDESAFPSLQKIVESDSSTKYLPYVSNPLDALEALNYETHHLSSIQSSQSLPNSSKLLFVVKLEDQNDENGLELSQRHDEVMHELCSKIQEKYEKAVCVLTAKRRSWIEPEQVSYSGRKLLQTIDSNNLNVYYKKDIGMIYTREPPTLYFKTANETANLSIPTNPSVTKGNNSLDISLTSSKGSVSLSFTFILSNTSYSWQLNEVKVNANQKSSVLKTNSFIGASIGNSFHTPSDVVFDSDIYSLKFSGLQVQYFEKSSSQVFGPAEDSVYFFTIPILSGLFVTSFIVAIALIGLTMIFDIKTMDQFDDPKGKSITINASD